MPLRSPLRQAENVREFDDQGTARSTTDAVMYPTARQRRLVPKFEMVGRRHSGRRFSARARRR